MKIINRENFLSKENIVQHKLVPEVENIHYEFSPEQREELEKTLTPLQKKCAAEDVFPVLLDSFLSESENACNFFLWAKLYPEVDQKINLLDMIKTFKKSLSFLDKIRHCELKPIIPRRLINEHFSPLGPEVFSKNMFAMAVLKGAQMVVPPLKALVCIFEKELTELNHGGRGAPPSPVTQFITILAHSYQRSFGILPTAYSQKKSGDKGGPFVSFLGALFPMIGLHFNDSTRAIRKAVFSLRQSPLSLPERMT